MLGMEPDQMGMLGLLLLRQANNPNFNVGKALGMLNSNMSQMTPMPQIQQPQAVSPVSPVTPNMSTPTNINLSPEVQAQEGDMLSRLRAAAEASYPNSPIMQQVALTQAIHESGALGKGSKLASEYNNYFGIKSPKGVSMQTQEYYNGQPSQINDSFATNNTMQDSFNQYKNLISKPRYQSVMSAQDPNSAFAALQKSGYATDPRYAQKLQSVYNRYVQPLYMR